MANFLTDATFAGNITTGGGLTFSSGTSLIDNGSSYVDLKYSDGGDGGLRVIDSEGQLQGYLYGNGGATSEFGLLTGAGAWAVRTVEGGLVELRHNNSIKLTTTTNGITVTGGLTVGAINSTGTITMSGGGVRAIVSGGDIALKTSTGEYALYGAANGNTNLYYNGLQKFRTGPDGVVVTGNITISGTVDGVDIAALNTAVAANTSKTGITSAQASAITANTAKTGITSSQASAITANTSKTGISTGQANAITANTNKTGISSAQTSAITANTAKTGISSAQTSAITANTAKTGITSSQASAITANTSKTGITSSQASAITANTSKTGITSAQASAITANTSKTGITSSQSSAITANTAKTGVTSGTQSFGGAKTFTTTPISVTRSTADSSTYLATTAFVKNQGYLPVAGPTFTGTITGPNANFTSTVTIDNMLTITIDDISTGENRGLRLINENQTDQQWNITAGVTGVENDSFCIRDATGNVNALKLTKGSGDAIFSRNLTAGGTLAAAGLTTSGNIIINGSSRALVVKSSNDQVVSSIVCQGNAISTLGFQGTSSANDYNCRVGVDGNDFVLYTVNSIRMRIDTSGNTALSGDLTVTGGDIVLGGTGRIQGIDTVSAGTDAASKDYIDNSIGRGTLSMTTSTGLNGSASFSANSSSNQTFAVTMDLNELNDVDGDADIIDFFVAVDESDDSVRIGRDDMKNVDAHWKHTPFVLNSNFLEQTNTSSYINVPFNNTNDSTSSEYYNFFGCPYPGRVKSMTLMHVDGNMSSGFTTQLRVKKNGATAYTSGELTPSNGTNDGSYVQQDDIHTSFVKGDRLQFALGKSISSRYWQGATMTIVLEFLQYNS